MEHLTMHSVDGVSMNVERIAVLFPNCVTERKGEDGSVERAIDFDLLRQELSRDIIKDGEERYQFTWPGKREAIRLANAPTNCTLRPVREESVDFDNTQNLYIEGDNLEVLKLLRETYLGKVKMIYIDPPYNTGKEFVYNDNRTESLEEYKKTSALFDDQGNMLLDNYTLNTEADGRFHTKWLNLMYPRIKVARDLLSEDGVIFISIDDHEVENLKKLCDIIFGESNFVGQLIIKTATDNNPSQINIEHEYMICFAKNKVVQSNWTRKSEAARKITEQYLKLKSQGLSLDDIQSRLRAWIKAHKDELPQVAHYNNVDDKGVYSSSSNSSNPHPGGYMFNIHHPITGGVCPKPANGWRWPEKTFWAYDEKGDIEWGKDETTQPHVKKRIDTCLEYLRTLIYEDNRATTKLLADLFDGKKVFENPKPVSVISRIIEFVVGKEETVLDFFSGSATTAHAVMQLNAEDSGNRKFIMVQIPELTDKKSEAYKAGYTNICEIGKERIRRAGKLIKIEHPESKDLDTGFRVLRLSSSNMEDVYYTPDKFDPNSLTGLFDNVKSDRSDEDLLFQVMLELDVPLSASIEVEQIAGKRVFNVSGGHLIATFDKDVNETTVTEIAKCKPNFFVMRDASAANDNVLDNFEQIFRHFSPDTVCKIL